MFRGIRKLLRLGPLASSAAPGARHALPRRSLARASVISVAISSLLLVPLASQQVPAQASGAEVDKFLSLGDNSDAGTDPGLNDGLTAGNSTVSASGQRSAGGVIPESSDFSIEAWVHPDSLDNANAWHQVFQQAGTSSSNYGRFGLNLYTNITGLPAGSAGVQVIVDGLNKFTNVETARVYEDRWTHIALTVDAGATTVLKLYLDGNLIATESGAPNGSYNVRSTDFTIGYYPESFDTTDRHFNGGIDQVKVWDGILSDSQVAQSMHSFGSNGVTSAPYLRAHVDFNEDYLDSTENFTFSTVGTVATSTLAATTTDGSDTIVSFPRSYLNSSGGWTVPANVTTADVLVVGGGGAGGSTNYGAAGGGGGGRVLDSTLDLTGVSSVKVTVGQGGIPIAAAASAVAPDTGFDGQSSILVPAGGSEISALGGGGGANARLYSYGQPAPSTTGWTGGGGSAHASSSSSSGSQGIGGSSFEGGDGNPSGTGSYQSGGGGGGAGGLGTDATDGQGGTGGAGVSSDIQGGALLLGGGGGGGVRYDSGVPGAGQAGGGSGGDGGDGVSGTANTGGGGGGAGEQSGPNPGGFGGSGIVVVRYTTPVVPSTVQNFSAATRLIDADSDTDSVTLNWDALTGQTPAVTSYEIEYSTASNYAASSTQSVAVTNASAATPNTVTISGLTDGATYYFRIKARNAVGDSASYAETSSVAVSNADYAVELTSSGQFADSGTGVAVVPASDSSYTIEAWVKPAAVTSETYYVIASQNQLGTGTDANKIFLSLKKDGSSYDLYYSSHTDVAATISLSDSSIPIGDWSHIALVANSTKFQVYVNGVMVSEVSATVTSVNADNAPFSIGSSGGTDPRYQFSGSIDQVKVWNTARSQDQIASSMHVWGATSGDESALLSHYDFNDNTQATTLRDQAGSNDLTYTSVATSDLIPLVEKDTTSRSGYAVYEFKRSYLTATGGWTSEASVSGAEALVVGGGGAGGFARAHSAGGGGGGEVNASTIDLSSGSAVVVKVGQGGVSAIADNGVKAEVVASEIRPTAGQTSELSGITAKPGAFGSSGYTTVGGGASARIEPGAGETYYSGGGNSAGYRSAATLTGGSGASTSGGAAYTGSSDTYTGGGGGGAAGNGVSGSSNVAGNGGNGASSSITGSPVALGGGGGGGIRNDSGTQSSGGTGGGGAGGIQTAGTSGLANSGGGGGGGGSYTTTRLGGNGGSGVVILAYSLAPSAPTITGVSSVTATTASVAFTAPSQAPETITKYQWTADGSTWYDIAGTSSPLSITGLTQNTTYGAFKIRAVSGSFNGTASAAATSFTTLAAYSITYNANSATSGTVPSSQTKTNGIDLTLATNSGSLVRTGYTFAGWNTQADGLGTDYAAGSSYSVEAADELFAKWTADSHTVTWNSNGGSSVTSSAVNTDANLTAPTSPTRSGYHFAGWSATNVGSVVTFPFAHGKTDDFTMYAVWERASYTVTYNYNYGSEANTTATHASGEKVTLPTPTRGGFNFKGWYTASSGGTKVGDAGDEVTTLATTDLILRYELDDPSSYSGTGTTIADVSGLGTSNATATNGPVFSTADGMSFAMDGSNDYILTSNLLSRAGASNTNISIFAWVKPTGNGVVVSEIGQATINTSWHDSQIEVVDGKFKFRTWSPDGFSTEAVTSDSITLNQWYYVGLVYDGTKLTGYVDGVSVGSTANYTRSAPTTGLYYALGATDSTNLGDGTYGDFRLGSFHVYKSGLTAATVLDNYQATCARFVDGCTEQTLFAQWDVSGYVVTYAAGDNGTGASQTATKTDGVNLTLPDSATVNGYFTRTGYTVTSWSTNSDGTTSDYALGGTYSADAIETLYPVWTADTYTITFNQGDDGTGADETDTKTHDVDFTIPNSATSNGYFTRTGYTISSWSTNSDGSTSDFAFGATYSTEAADTLYPVWTADTYTITFNKGDDGTGADETATKTHDVDLTLPNSSTANGYFTKTGYSVTAWSENADGSTTDYALAGTYDTEVADTLYPVWTANTYTVTYDYNGATGGNGAATSSYTVDGIVVSLPTPTKPGFTFAGWYSDSGLTSSIGVAGASYSPSANVTAYAKWSAATFTVIYAYNDADGGNSTASNTFTTGSTVITLPTPTRTGYTFGGWYSNSNLTDLSTVGAGGANYSPTTNLTIYAKWTAVTRSVTYNTTNAGSGTAPTDATSYTIGQNVVLKSNSGSLARTGYTFAGWVTNNDGSGTAKNAGETLSVETADINFYPQWSANTYTITYHPNGASGSLAKATDSFTTGDSNITLPGAGTMTKVGYDFGAWSTTPTGSSVGSTYSTTQDITLYAIWTLKSITYSYAKGADADGTSLASFSFSASFPTGSTATYGTAVTLSSSVDAEIDAQSPAGIDHQFFGWSDGTSVYDTGDTYILGESDPTFTAQWAKVYSVRYSVAGGTFAGSDGITDSDCLGGDNTCSNGDFITLNSAPTRTGYTFTGWEDQAGDSFTAGQENVQVKATSYLFYAQWQAIQYNMGFNSLGGSNAISNQTKTIGQLLTMPNPGTKTGYSFGGWSDGSELFGVGTTFTVGSSSKSFSAVWNPNVYTVTYDWQGGVASGAAKAADSYTVGTGAMTLPTAVGSSYARDGYDFAGWSTSAGGSAVSSFEPTADDVLYALWDDGNFTLSYDAKGGTGSGAGSVARTVAVTMPTPVRSNFTFVGWYDQATGGSKLADGGASYTPVASTSFYARWVQNSLYGVDEATLETAATLTVGGDQSGGSLTRNHSASGTAASVVVPDGALPADTVLTARYFRDTERQSGLIPGDNSYIFSLLVSWLSGTGDSATVPNTATGKPITVTLTSSAIKIGQMIYQVVGTTVTELGRATSDGSITVELTEDPEIVIAATKPNAPTSISAVAGDTQATVSWSAPESGGSAITSYTVTSTPGSFTCTTATTSCVVTGLTNGTSYTFTVTASNSVGTSSSSGSSSSIAVAATTYNASFNANGGSSVSTATFIAGGSISEPAAPTKSGYSFNGWSTTLDDVATKVSFPYSPGVTTNITLYALWTETPAPASSGSNNTPVVAPTPPVTPVTKPGGSVAGSSEQVKIVADAPKEKLVATGAGWELQVAAKTSAGAPAPVKENLNLEFQLGSRAAVSGSGLRPKTTVSVWVFSDPTFVGEVETDSTGAFDSNLVLPSNILPGDHTLQVLSTDSVGRVITLNIPITVKGKVTVGSFKGYLALYTKDLVGQKLSAKVAGKWIVQNPIANYKSYGYSRVVRKTGAGYRIYVHLYLNGAFLRTDVLTTK